MVLYPISPSYIYMPPPPPHLYIYSTPSLISSLHSTPLAQYVRIYPPSLDFYLEIHLPISPYTHVLPLPSLNHPHDLLPPFFPTIYCHGKNTLIFLSFRFNFSVMMIFIDIIHILHITWWREGGGGRRGGSKRWGWS